MCAAGGRYSALDEHFGELEDIRLRTYAATVAAAPFGCDAGVGVERPWSIAHEPEAPSSL